MTSGNGSYEKMREIFNSMGGVDIHNKKGGRFHYTMYVSPQMEEAGIDSLDLSVRATNGLRRAGYQTVGGLCKAISSGTDIRRIRSCGEKTYSEIMEKLFLFNLSNIPEQSQRQYIMETIEKNLNQK